MPPQPSGILPQTPVGQDEIGVQPHWPATPPPPQVCGAIHVPQLPPQPSSPQVFPVQSPTHGVTHSPLLQTCPAVQHARLPHRVVLAGHLQPFLGVQRPEQHCRSLPQAWPCAKQVASAAST